MKILVTGGAGFIGSALIRYLIGDTEHTVVNVDKLTYAADCRTLESVASSQRYHFEHVDICNGAALARIFAEHQPNAVMHLAAESHVDRSIDTPADFIETNVVGTYCLLESAEAYRQSLEPNATQAFRFLHVSTDEVYGALGETGYFTEETPYAPTSPYSATKASSDHLANAWFHTFGLPTIVTHCGNNYGPYQFPEKLIPLVILKALSGQSLPVYGNGRNVRDWIHVDDHARALYHVLLNGQPGRTYNIGGEGEKRNLEVVQSICEILECILPRAEGSYQDLISFVQDRPGHDYRYAIDTARMREDLNWQPLWDFERGLQHTVNWYLDNEAWWAPLIDKHQATQRC